MLYIVVETSYYGPTLGYKCESPNLIYGDEIENLAVECCVDATDRYKQLHDNDDVPYKVLFDSVKVIGISTYRPSETYIQWV